MFVSITFYKFTVNASLHMNKQTASLRCEFFHVCQHYIFKFTVNTSLHMNKQTASLQCEFFHVCQYYILQIYSEHLITYEQTNGFSQVFYKFTMNALLHMNKQTDFIRYDLDLKTIN